MRDDGFQGTRGNRTKRSIARLAVVIASILAGSVVHVPAGDARAATAKTATIRQFSPQGEVASVRQARATFSEAMVDFGDPRLAAPFDVQCVASAAASAGVGTGRWANDRTWSYDFNADLGPGTRCSFTLKADARTRDGASVAGKTAFTFSTGGPAIVRNFPAAGGEGGPGIDEEQTFVLVLNGPATRESVLANAWCEVSGIGERIAVRLIEGADRIELLKRFALETRTNNVTMLSCARRLPNSAKLALVWGKGIASPSGIATTVERRLSFHVRPDFAASFTCERENAQAACTPVRPVRIEFTSPIARAMGERFVLRYVDGAKTIEKQPTFDADNRSASVSQIEFKPPFAENAELTIAAPKDLTDDAGRPLSNASLFPLKSRTALAPPLAKFAASPFGILELNADPVVPLTVRHVEAALDVKGVTVTTDAQAAVASSPQGTMRTVRVAGDSDDAALIEWQRRVKRYHESSIPKAGIDPADLPPAIAKPRIDRVGERERERVGRNQRSETQQARVEAREDNTIATRELSLLKRNANAKSIALPASQYGDPRPFEVIGIPLPEPGFHIIEIESQRLGAALLGKPATMYVRTTALVTNLGVHVKIGRVNAGVWVTTLERAQPVAGAAVQVSDCNGKPLWNGVTDARGFAFVPRAFPAIDYNTCRTNDDEGSESGYFVSARKPIVEGANKGKVDMAFVWSDWNQGIESWRFNLPNAERDYARRTDDDRGRLIAHTVFDRTLLRAGQTVSMKHYARREDLVSLALPDAKNLPTQVEITHVGSDQKYPFDLTWRAGRYAETSFEIPQDAKLGLYVVALKEGNRRFETGSFRVEEFRLPVMRGRIDVRANETDGKAGSAQRDFVRPSSLTANVSIAYTNGGSASALPVRVSAALKPRYARFAGYDGYSFVRVERDDDNEVPFDDFVDDGPRATREPPGQRIVADKLAVTLDKDGAGKVALKDLPPIDAPRDLLVEATYPDPNGEIQTLSQTVSLWPAALAVGVRADDWVSVRGKTTVKLVAVDTHGKPVAGASIELRGIARNIRSIRKRMVGGFYAYDNQRESKELGVLCSGQSNAQGLVFCKLSLAEPGNVELLASVKDAAGNSAQASASVWVTRQAEVWFGGENQDRIDVLPEKKSYAPGEVAKFQVRMPFRAATALIAIERDGIIATQVVEIRGDDPSIAVKVEPDWAPNVYVSVLAVRGRIRDVPWYSLFTWGWKSPLAWWRAYRDEGKLYEPPTALVDLSKPAFKYGIASIQVDNAAHRLKVAVTTDKPDYAVRATAKTTVRVTTPDGKPVAAGTEVALAAVDEALLELMPNLSWDLFDAMIRERGYGIETATAQMQIIGKRHYGRKAAPPGGGGGVSPSRELFDTLLVWKPSVVLDANGSATIDVPLNDSLTAFRIVAIADAGTALFGTGSATIRSRQDLQIVAGLPPLVREGDRYQASITLRNTTRAAMDVDVHATLTPTMVDATMASIIEFQARRLHLEAESSQLVEWPVTTPDNVRSISWRVDSKANANADAKADAKSASASDSITVSQRVIAAIPVTVQQATLAQLDKSFTLPIAAPADAIADASGALRGGIWVALKPRLADSLPGVRDWLLRYPYSCLEQKASIAIGTLDEMKWDEVARQIPLYLDNDGLASYFPPRADEPASGSDVLTAYLLTASAEASTLGRYAIPDATRAKMESGLIAFVEGRIKRAQWSPFTTDAQRQLDVRKLAALEALTRSNKATPRVLQSIQVLPNQWPTSAVIDWMLILKRVTAIPNRNARLSEADQILRSRLNYQGTRLDFSTEKDDFWYWLMASGDGNAARLLMAVLDDPAWKDDAPRLVIGALQRQHKGHWLTTTANVWGTLAVNEFSKRFERDAVKGMSRASIAGDSGASTSAMMLSWSEKPQGGTLVLPWPGKESAKDATPRRDLQVTQDGSGKPWLTVQSLAAVPLKAPFSSGYRITRTITPVEQKIKDAYSRGDVLRIKLDIDAQTDMSWVVVSDPIPGGASVLGTGLGRDSQIAVSGEKRQGWAWPAYEEKSFEAYRAYYGYVPKGKFSIEYTVRLNNVGKFGLPPTRVEAMYAPEMFGETPNAAVEVKP